MALIDLEREKEKIKIEEKRERLKLCKRVRITPWPAALQKRTAKIVPRDYLDGRHDWMCQSCGKAVEGYQPPSDVILYDKMVLAINECHQTDEVKNIRDQAPGAPALRKDSEKRRG